MRIAAATASSWHPLLAGSLLAALLAAARPASPAAARPGAMPAPYDRAQRLHEALEGRPEQQRTRRDYDRVLNAYRSVYHGDPASPHADASINAVADLLAEEGRLFEDEKALHDAIGQYEFLRMQYPGSRYRFSALLAEGEIFEHDLNDRAGARAAFERYLKLYPRNALAEQARSELRTLHQQELAAHRTHAQTAHRQRPATPDTQEQLASSNAAVARQPAASASSSLRTSAEEAQQAGRKPVRPSFPASRQARQPLTQSAGRPPNTTPPATTAPSQATRAVEPAPQPALSDAVMSAPPPPRRSGRLPLVTGIRHWSTPVYTRVAIDLQDEVQYEAARVPVPDRIFFDLHGARLAPELIGRSFDVTDDGFLKRVRAAQFSNDVTRIVLDVSDVSEYSAFFLPNPPRLIIDVHGRKPGESSTLPSSQLAERQERTAPAVNLRPTASSEPEKQQALITGDPKPRPASQAGDIAALSQQPNKIKATRHPTTEPVVSSVAGTTPAPQPNDAPPQAAPAPQPATASMRQKQHLSPPAASSGGERSMVRALGLKINRIVIDAGHGGHDSGTLGPDGIEEKNVVLDVALRLGKLLKQRLGADVIYTRDDDTFIPLETRTAIANKAQADLFLSVHANSSRDVTARGVETYYLNFTSSADALEVAARENAVSEQSIHQLSDLVKKIALQDKISESREFALDVDQSLYQGLEPGNDGLRDRGVKKAPFVVLIGANMPSVLAEISFLTNPQDAHELREAAYRERIAESLYRGVSRYVGSLNGVHVAQVAGSDGVR